MRYFFALVLLAMISTTMYAQPSCYQAYPSYFKSMPQLTSLPPLSGSMSFNEIIGHIVLDSICRLTEVNQIDSFMQARLSWDDTLKSMYKYMTTVVDSDPLLVFGINHAVSEWRLSFPGEVRMHLARAIEKHSPSPNLDLAIAKSDYILQVTIYDTTGVIDTSAKFARTAIVATGNITDTILGHVFPYCSGPQLLPTSSSSPQCITFDVRREQVQYWRERTELNATDTIIDGIVPQPSRQYLVFLQLVRLCTDSSNLYFTLLPVYSAGPRCGIYEIHGARISDEMNYFNLGLNPLVLDVVAAIEARILQVKTSVP